MLKNFKVIEVISQKSRALLTFYQGRLKFNHHTAAELNFSQYVQLAYDSNQQCFAIIAATKDSENAVQFYNRGEDAKPYPISLYTKAAIFRGFIPGVTLNLAPHIRQAPFCLLRSL